MSTDNHPFPSALWIAFSVVLSMVISFVLMFVLWLPCNALAAVGKSVVGVYLVTLVSPISVLVGSTVAFRIALRKAQPKNYKMVRFVVGIPLFLLGMAASFFFPTWVGAVFKQVAWGVGAGMGFDLGAIGTLLTFCAIAFSYRRQIRKVTP